MFGINKLPRSGESCVRIYSCILYVTSSGYARAFECKRSFCVRAIIIIIINTIVVEIVIEVVTELMSVCSLHVIRLLSANTDVITFTRTFVIMIINTAAIVHHSHSMLAQYKLKAFICVQLLLRAIDWEWIVTDGASECGDVPQSIHVFEWRC